jgi:hypothetical protein
LPQIIERLGPLPLINHFIVRMGLDDALARHVPSDQRCVVPHARALGVLLRSIIVEREPIYRQQERKIAALWLNWRIVLRTYTWSVAGQELK